MSRLPPIPPSEQTPEQQQAQAAIESLGPIVGKSFAAKNRDGALIGPFAPMLYTPQLVPPFVSLATLIPTMPHVPSRVRELAILATASTYNAPFVLQAHSHIAQTVGISSEQISDARSGTMPTGLSEEEQAGWEFAKKLSKTPGPLDTAVWEKAKECLGIEGVAGLAHVVASYASTCLFHNASGVGLPSGETT